MQTHHNFRKKTSVFRKFERNKKFGRPHLENSGHPFVLRVSTMDNPLTADVFYWQPPISYQIL